MSNIINILQNQELIVISYLTAYINSVTMSDTIIPHGLAFDCAKCWSVKVLCILSDLLSAALSTLYSVSFTKVKSVRFMLHVFSKPVNAKTFSVITYMNFIMCCFRAGVT